MPNPGERRPRRLGCAPAGKPALTRASPRLVALIGRLIADGPKHRPPLIAIVGAQGSGKTTLAQTAATVFGAAQISIDDVYLTQAERKLMARTLHPLFLTRGPPGTHDLGLLQRLIDDLSQAGTDAEVRIPVFDKRGDERLPGERWRSFQGRPSAILIDAWCLGAVAQDAAALALPINDLEQRHDVDGCWRALVNDHLAKGYAALAKRMDAILFLRAPSFENILDWRCQQEADLLGIKPCDLPDTERARLADFIQYFERITRQMIAGSVRADITITLDHWRRPGANERV